MKVAKETCFVVLTLLSASFSVGCSSDGSSDSSIPDLLLVEDQEGFEEAAKSLKPGDTITLANGVWNNFEILFTGEGTEDAPIRLTAQDKGKVILTGQSNLRIAGEYLEVSGLVFKDGFTPSELSAE